MTDLTSMSSSAGGLLTGGCELRQLGNARFQVRLSSKSPRRFRGNANHSALFQLREITFANAGHPPLYRNGEEIQLDASFPLGITPEVEYDETTVWLDRGDKVTFVSDGVLEARNEAGGIFGVDRTREISGQSAQAIAKAAQQFGQEDDITVLTLSFSHPDLVIA